MNRSRQTRGRVNKNEEQDSTKEGQMRGCIEDICSGACERYAFGFRYLLFLSLIISCFPSRSCVLACLLACFFFLSLCLYPAPLPPSSPALPPPCSNLLHRYFLFCSCLSVCLCFLHSFNFSLLIFLSVISSGSCLPACLFFCISLCLSPAPLPSSPPPSPARPSSGLLQPLFAPPSPPSESKNNKSSDNFGSLPYFWARLGQHRCSTLPS